MGDFDDMTDQQLTDKRLELDDQITKLREQKKAIAVELTMREAQAAVEPLIGALTDDERTRLLERFSNRQDITGVGAIESQEAVKGTG